MKFSLLLAFLVVIGPASYGQFDPSAFLKGSQSDINYLGGEYLKPAGKALVAGINNGWYNTAKVHKPGRFEVNFSTGLIFIPEEGRTFMIDDSKLQNLELVEPSDNVAPTAFGERNSGPMLRSKTDPNLTFNSPSGMGTGIFPQLNLNLEIGIGLHSEILVRYFPSSPVIGIKNSQVSLYGFGINHSFLEWIPVAKRLPFSASVMLAYTRLDYSQDLNTSLDGENQQLQFSTYGYTARVLISKKVAFISFYGGAGLNNGVSTMKLNGTYSYESNGQTVNMENPLETDATVNEFVGNMGTKLKFLSILSFNADYTFGEYEALTLGLGLDVDF